MRSASSANTHHNVTFSHVTFEVHGKIWNIKHWIFEKQNIAFSWNKEFRKFCHRDYIFRSYCFFGGCNLSSLEYFFFDNVGYRHMERNKNGILERKKSSNILLRFWKTSWTPASKMFHFSIVNWNLTHAKILRIKSSLELFHLKSILIVTVEVWSR